MATLGELLEARTIQAAPELVETIDRGRLVPCLWSRLPDSRGAVVF